MRATEHAVVSKVDNHLKDVALLQFTFKPGKIRAVAQAIAQAFNYSVLVWADEVQLPPLGPEDANCIGTVWKNLARWNIIERLEGATDHRRSRKDGRKGGVVWKYRLKDPVLLRAFMRANQIEIKTKQYIQPELMS